MMPDMDGIEAAEKIREIGTDYAKNIPIIALTANVIAGNERMFLSKGFADFLSKPIDIARLDSVIRHWVRDKSHSKLIELPDRRSAKSAVQDRSCPKRRFSDYQIDGIDLIAGIDRFGGDNGAYLQVLRSFTANTRNLLNSIKDVREEDLNNYAIIVHGIKGSCRSICANLTGDIAEALEKAAKEGDFGYVSEKAPDLVQAIVKLLADLDEMQAKISALSPKPKKLEPDKDVLVKILEACYTFDMQTVEAAVKELESYEYETNGEFVPWLWENVQQFNVDEIIGRLSKMDLGKDYL
jgi:CheY-like chemotaxis protein